MEVSKNGGIQKWLLYEGKSHQNGWLGGTPFSGNLHISIYIYIYIVHIWSYMYTRQIYIIYNIYII